MNNEMLRSAIHAEMHTETVLIEITIALFIFVIVIFFSLMSGLKPLMIWLLSIFILFISIVVICST